MKNYVRKVLISRLLLTLIGLSSLVIAQQPTSPYNFVLNRIGTTPTIDNSINRYNNWTFSYTTTGFTKVIIAFEGADNPPNFTNFANGTSQGNNPSSLLNSASYSVQGYYHFIRANLVYTEGTGVVSFTITANGGGTGGGIQTINPGTGIQGGGSGSAVPIAVTDAIAQGASKGATAVQPGDTIAHAAAADTATNATNDANGNPIGAVRVTSLPGSCVVGTSKAVVFNNGGTDAIYTAQGSPCAYALPPGSSLTALQTAVQGTASSNSLRDFISAADIRWAGGIIYDGVLLLSQQHCSAIAGNVTVICTGANFSGATDVNKTFQATDIGTSFFMWQSRIATVVNSTTITLRDAPPNSWGSAQGYIHRVVYGTNNDPALAALAASSSTTVAFQPNQTFIHSTGIALYETPVNFGNKVITTRGSGANSTQMMYTGTTVVDAPIQFGSTNIIGAHGEVSGVSFYGNQWTKFSIKIIGSSSISINNVRLGDSTEAGMYLSAQSVTLNNVSISGNDLIGFANGAVPQYGIEGYELEKGTITGLSIDHVSSYGIWLTDNGTIPSDALTIDGAQMSQNGGCVKVDGPSGGVKFVNLLCENSTGVAALLNGSSVRFDGGLFSGGEVQVFGNSNRFEGGFQVASTSVMHVEPGAVNTFIGYSSGFYSPTASNMIDEGNGTIFEPSIDNFGKVANNFPYLQHCFAVGPIGWGAQHCVITGSWSSAASTTQLVSPTKFTNAIGKSWRLSTNGRFTSGSNTDLAGGKYVELNDTNSTYTQLAVPLTFDINATTGQFEFTPSAAGVGGFTGDIYLDLTSRAAGSETASFDQFQNGFFVGSTLTNAIKVYNDGNAHIVGETTSAHNLFISGSTIGMRTAFGSANICTFNVSGWTCPTFIGPSAGSETVTFSATPTFAITTRSSIVTLTANITSFTIAAGSDGQQKVLTFCQNATGGFIVAAPANVRGFFTVGTIASKCNTQAYTYSIGQTAWLAESSGLINQ